MGNWTAQIGARPVDQPHVEIPAPECYQSRSREAH